MNDFFKKLVDQAKSLWAKTSLVQKIIAGAIVVAAIGLSVGVFVFTSHKPGILLFNHKLSSEDVKRITAVLDQRSIAYEYSNGYVYIVDPARQNDAQLAIVQEGAMPEGVNAYELVFKRDNMFQTPTAGEMEAKQRVAAEKALTDYLNKLDFVSEATVRLTFPKKEFLTDVEQPVTASVILTPAPYKSDVLTDTKTMEGLRKLIANAVDKLIEENVEIFDNSGNLLTDFSGNANGDEIKLVEAQLKVVNKETKLIESKILRQLGAAYRDRIFVAANVEFGWDREEIQKNEIIPIEITPEDPSVSYSTRVVATNVIVSDQETEETYKGPLVLPQGAAGAEELVPPGVVDRMDRWNTYQENSKIRNFDTSKKLSWIKNNYYKLKRVSVSVMVDGKWALQFDEQGNYLTTNGGAAYAREYTPVSNDELRSMENLIRGAIGYDVARQDVIQVEHLPFDRSAEHDAEDAKLRRQRMIRQTLIIALITLVALFVIAVAVRAIQREIARRRRLAEEERERRQSELRNQVIIQAQEEPITEMSIEDAARKKLYEDSINLARDRPDDVAMLLRTWMADEGAK